MIFEEDEMLRMTLVVIEGMMTEVEEVGEQALLVAQVVDMVDLMSEEDLTEVEVSEEALLGEVVVDHLDHLVGTVVDEVKVI